MPKSRKQKILFITDPWETLDHPKDTTLRIIEETLRSGQSCFWAESGSVAWTGRSVCAHVQEIKSIYPGRETHAFLFKEAILAPVSIFKQIHYRVDPPIVLAYEQPLRLLALGAGNTEIVNPAHQILTRNEKLESLGFAPFSPQSLVSSNLSLLRQFGEKHRDTVCKPLFQAQSKNVDRLLWNTTVEKRLSLETLAHLIGDPAEPVLLQTFLPEIESGETRIWFLDGKVLACVRKLPATGTFRINMDQGGSLAPHRLSSRESKVAKAIAQRLKDLEIRLAAVDLIGGLVTDFNITSPGLLVQMEDLYRENFCTKVVRALS